MTRRVWIGALAATVLGLGGWIAVASSAKADAQSDRWTFTLCYYEGGDGYGIKQCQELRDRCAKMDKKKRRRHCAFEIPGGTADRVSEEILKKLEDEDAKVAEEEPGQ
jgi:hypothetical protein